MSTNGRMVILAVFGQVRLSQERRIAVVALISELPKSLLSHRSILHGEVPDKDMLHCAAPNRELRKMLKFYSHILSLPEILPYKAAYCQAENQSLTKRLINGRLSAMVLTPEKISEVMQELGRRGGRKKSAAKSHAVRANLKKARAAKKKSGKSKRGE